MNYYMIEINSYHRLKNLLSVPTYTWEEQMLIEHICKQLDERGYTYELDDLGSIYVTKGKSDFYPCLVAHLDSVHMIEEYTVEEKLLPNTKGVEKLSFVAIDSNGKRTGIGGDDKAGVFICLEILDRFDNIKAFFPVAEETGCHGSRNANPEFFKDVGYAIQFDSTENDTMSQTLMGLKLYEENGEFINKCKDLILEHGIDKWKHHPYTDTMILKEKFDFSCLNFAAGYYGWHSKHEYVILEDVQNAINLGVRVIEELGENKYTFKSKQQQIRYY